MSKNNTARKQHWRSRTQDSFVPLTDSSGELGVAVGGGADYGEFPFVTAAPGDGLAVGDIILEIGGTPVLGMTLGDVRGVLNSCPHPVRIKTVSPGATLCKDLRLYLSKCFTPGSVDGALQQVIRENLYLRAVPCTTRPPRAGEISGTDYNFVSVEEFFSLEGSGALLESGKFKGNYYGTPRPVHVGTDSPPITYQEHRKLLRKFRTRSKSLSHLEKAVSEAERGDEDLGLRGGRRPPGGRRASTDGVGCVLENGFLGNGAAADRWEQAFSDPGGCLYVDHKRTSWQSPRAASGEPVYKTQWFTEHPEELRGFLVRTRLIKGVRGFGFNIVGGSKPREFLQVYSVTSSGPPDLQTADILVYVDDLCVLGVSHKKVVEMLKSIPVGHSVDIAVRRGYPMLYNPDGCPKHSPGEDPVLLPTTSQPEPLHHLSRRLTPSPHGHLFNGLHADYLEPGGILDANGNASRRSSLRRSSLSNTASPPLTRPPRSLRSLARLQSLEPTFASQSDSEVVSAIGSHRASMIRNHNNNSLSTPQHPLRYGKSSESDLSTCALPLPQSPQRPSSSPGGSRGAHARLFRPQPSHLRPGPTPESPRRRPRASSDGFGGDGGPAAGPGKMSSPGGGLAGFTGGELVPVALAQSEADRGLGFSLMASGPGGGSTVVRRVWDRKQCNTLQPGDAVVKINGADVQSLSLAQVQTVLQEHTRQGEVILLVYRGGINRAPGAVRRLPPPLLRPPPPPGASDADALSAPRTSIATPTRSSLIQSTSFLESIPVTLTMEPKDWIGPGLRDAASGEEEGARPLRGFDVELRRKLGEGFGFVIASQDLENVKAASLLPHRFVTVRRGSPAAKSGQIRPGDRLEAVEGRPVVTLPHRELAQILRRAGNTLRLTVVPRPGANSTSLSEPAESDLGHRSRKGQRSRPKRDSRYYGVDLERGPSGFGFSLRGGSEYNMGLYVLALMEGGPASRSHKMQVSDQLVEINGDGTAGMTHSQAVERIRTGGRRIRLVLKRGNGYVPDYGRERRVASPSRLRHPKEQGMAAVDTGGQRGRRSKRERRGGSWEGRGKGTGRRRRRGPGGSSRRTRASRSLPPPTDDGQAGRVRKGERGRSGERKDRKEEVAPAEERPKGSRVQEEEELERGEALPIPSPSKKLPWPKAESEEDPDEKWEVAAGYRHAKWLRGLLDHDDDFADHQSGDDAQGAATSADAVTTSGLQRKPFAFLASALSVNRLRDEESDSGGSQSDAASVSGLSAEASGRGALALPGPWLAPGRRGERADFGAVGTGNGEERGWRLTATGSLVGK
ncbi:membrane-associated guanylate kinase, WW and PDZ domain-containing protein 1 [Syngnathoides biaculeatus]|uniref:membrane-associated guanylate kinase, WW and PDZ domain-containing protein 1 n=1 Tax=Syngnathoides biaculeatus TaxID=300417 RepID=UPI002ADD6791|nr:membrane-associated guanylate kinase, WW and PDZ domain-containing protein 1 [Syngnathoides biaculeatus]